MIVGRDPHSLDRAGVSRAAIESLAENFSDGVVAPAFWYRAVRPAGTLRLQDDQHGRFDDRPSRRRSIFISDAGRRGPTMLPIRFPARMSAAIVALGAASLGGYAWRGKTSMARMRDAGLHRSPNAGWPESAFAAALGISLAGPRVYAGESVQQAWLNAAGRTETRCARHRCGVETLCARSVMRCGQSSPLLLLAG